jgi:tRNA dimethylallyltransferase
MNSQLALRHISMEKVIVVVGPTAVGKTALGVALAKAYNGEVISGDSMQIYQGMDIGTAKVTKEEMQGIVHHQIDIRTPFESYSVSDFQEDVRREIKEITSRGKMPIIVGGTGLYIKAALFDYTFEKSETNPSAMQQKYKDYSNEALYKHLLEIDPGATRNIHPNNRRRVLRAIEIYETTGHKKSETEAAQSHQMIYDAYVIGLTLPRKELVERINKRVDLMMDHGLKEEMDRLIKAGVTSDLQAMRGIGYKEWFPYYEGKASLEEVSEAIKIHSRQYAKRQYTWFNHQMQVNWYDVYVDAFDKTIKNVEGDVAKWIQL